MKHNMILSASGWRKVFAASGNEQDKNKEITEESKAISIVAGAVFFEYIKELTNQENPVIAVGMDTRPTGEAIVEGILKSLVSNGAIVQYCGVTSAPEIMSFAKKLDGFIYVSASHNPIGHNGIKFGINDGGVLSAKENAKIIQKFNTILDDDIQLNEYIKKANSCSSSELKTVYQTKDSSKFNALNSYRDFAKETITGTNNKEYQADFFGILHNYIAENPIGVVCDFNGSSRYQSIDRDFFKENNINFYTINEFEISHEIIPEAENLCYVQQEMERLQKEGFKDAVLGYMPDCDGDRGNIVYWDENQQKSIILKAQEVFSLSVLAELTYSIWQNSNSSNQTETSFKPAVAVNCPTSMRINEIVETLGGQLFRAEVGEANVVNLAREKRQQGFTVRILGEGSNGGTITYPAAVRDPLNTIFAIIKLLLLKENGLYELWCNKANIKYNPNFTLTDILDSLPKYTTTGVSEPRAVLKVKQSNHQILKGNFQKVFESEWKSKQSELNKKYGICSYEAITTNGTTETCNLTDFSTSNTGGLKILFKDSQNTPIAFIWMRGSQTEPVFRIMCDVKGNDPEMEKALLEWETKMIEAADK